MKKPERSVENCVEEIIDSLVVDVTYEKTWPAHTVYYQIDLNSFQERLKKTLQTERQRCEEVRIAEKSRLLNLIYHWRSKNDEGIEEVDRLYLYLKNDSPTPLTNDKE